jgi:hypothetical protein
MGGTVERLRRRGDIAVPDLGRDVARGRRPYERRPGETAASGSMTMGSGSYSTWMASSASRACSRVSRRPPHASPTNRTVSTAIA